LGSRKVEVAIGFLSYYFRLWFIYGRIKEEIRVLEGFVVYIVKIDS
jgi:hypothetical protein